MCAFIAIRVFLVNRSFKMPLTERPVPSCRPRAVSSSPVQTSLASFNNVLFSPHVRLLKEQHRSADAAVGHIGSSDSFPCHLPCSFPFLQPINFHFARDTAP